MSFQALPGDNSLNISMRLARCDVYIIFEFAADWVAGNKMKVGEIEVDAWHRLYPETEKINGCERRSTNAKTMKKMQ